MSSEEFALRIETDIAALRTAIQISKVLSSRLCAFCPVLNGRSAAGYDFAVFGYFGTFLGVIDCWQGIRSDVRPFLVTGCSALLVAYLRFRL
jgi:hypothetical protein